MLAIDFRQGGIRKKCEFLEFYSIYGRTMNMIVYKSVNNVAVSEEYSSIYLQNEMARDHSSCWLLTLDKVVSEKNVNFSSSLLSMDEQ